MWHICLGVSMAVLLFSAMKALMVAHGKKTSRMPPINILIIGVFAAAVIMFVPIYAEKFGEDNVVVAIFKTLVISVHHTIRLFIVDSDFEAIKDFINSQYSIFYNVYSCYAAFLFVLSPALTFGVLLSFFKNVSAYRKYMKNYNKDIYVFSKLNEKSIALAKSVMEHYEDSCIIFTNVNEQKTEDEINIAKGKELKAVCFEEDILSINFNLHSAEKEIKFFLTDDIEQENLNLSLSLIKKYKDREKTYMYVCSDSLEGEALLSSVDVGALKLRRINDVRTLIYNLLESEGELLFKESLESDNKRLISVLVVGLGKSGTEMTKTLAWFGQMEGYKLEINAFDMKKEVRDTFCELCPELMDDKHNNQFADIGEAQYSINIYGGVNAEAMSFFNKINEIKNITYIFVDLGTDEKNIRSAIKLRSLLAKTDRNPRINAVIRSTDRKRALKGITNHSGQSYNIDFVGDIESLYSVESMIDSHLQKEALSRHLKWGKEEDFWKYEYNHRSSIASALHKRMKIACNIPGIEKAPAERTEEERLNLRIMEHRRWNAYMRSEGFTYAEKRNNLAKTHPCLITYNDLNPEEKAKDDD